MDALPDRISINYGDQRKVYDTPYKPIPWEKTMKLGIGKAPKVEVFFKPGTAKILVKTFQFKSEKDRYVAVTVAIDARNTVTAKLVTIDAKDMDVDTTPKGAELILISANGECAAYKRTSQYSVFPRFSESDAPLDYLEDAVIASTIAVPPSRAAAAFISNLDMKHDARLRLHQLVEAAGYKNIRYINLFSMMFSSALCHAKPVDKVGDLIGMIMNEVFEGVNILRKTDDGYEFYKVAHRSELLFRYPTVKKLIYFNFDGIMNRHKVALKRAYRSFNMHFAKIDENHMSLYTWNQVDGGNRAGYLVTATTHCSFRIAYGSTSTTIDAESKPFPWQDTVELDIGDAQEVNVFMKFWDSGYVDELIKQYKFETKKDRNVKITISLDESRLPKIELQTL